MMLRRPGARVRAPLVPISDSQFVFVGAGAEVEIVGDAQGKVIQLSVCAVEGQIRGNRRGN